MIITNGQTLKINLSSTGNIDYFVDIVEHTDSGATDSNVSGNITSSGNTSLVSGTSGVQKQVVSASFINKSTTKISIKVTQNNGSSDIDRTASVSISFGESLVYNGSSQLWAVYRSNGSIKTQPEEIAVIDTKTIQVLKVGTATEAAGQYYSFSKDAGAPGAWSVGTPGLSGRQVLGSEAGAIALPAAGVGNWFIKSFNVSTSVACTAFLADFLWVNSGIVVTTTTAQTINSVSLPARDEDGTSNGKSINAALLVTTATTNASAIATITISYTNSDGVAGRTGTISSFPATAVIGTIVPFNLQSGDYGIRSIESITLGTTLAAGAVSLVLYRMLAMQTVPLANSAGNIAPQGTRIYDNTFGSPVILASATTATNLISQISLEMRS